MRNIINSPNVEQIVFRNYSHSYLVTISAINSKLVPAITHAIRAIDYIAIHFVTSKAFPLILQDPIKNIIGYPE